MTNGEKTRARSGRGSLGWLDESFRKSILERLARMVHNAACGVAREEKPGI